MKTMGFMEPVWMFQHADHLAQPRESRLAHFVPDDAHLAISVRSTNVRSGQVCQRAISRAQTPSAKG